MGTLWLNTVDSTNRVLRELALNGAEHGTVLGADTQTDGRGRGINAFYSPLGGLYFSVLLREPLPPPTELALTARAGLAVCAVMERYGVELGIKWVNDLFRNNKKIGGILTQALPEGSAVVGIGLNITKTEEPPEGLQNRIAYCVNTKNDLPNLRSLATEIAAELLDLAARRGSAENERLQEVYRRRSVVRGKKVLYTQNNMSIAATVLDITPTGGLLVRHTDGSTILLNSGEIHLLLAE
jgi:BirA family biotin operon repressor/biotin-[acetyl-CoA-carboxylase] ligase